jgi:hypothetical protein
MGLPATEQDAALVVWHPDIIVKANGSVSPIHSYFWVSGFEIAPSRITGIYFYYSGLDAQKNAFQAGAFQPSVR